MSEKIIDKNSSEQFIEDYRRYGMYITVRRTMPDYRDGLKPVQRRILWAMFNDSGAVNKTVKSASIIGDVMGKYHGHGDCLDGDTLLYDKNNDCFYRIEDLYNNGTESLDILAVDVKTGDVLGAVATNFRIGQYTNKIYNIITKNDDREQYVRCTANHPFLLKDLTWVKAEDLKVGDVLCGKRMTVMGSISDKDTEIVDIVIEDVDNIPMYDFTVEEYENMLIPIASTDLGDLNFICVHNSSIYGTMKPMVNWFESYLPTIDKQGNFGNFQGHPASAYRYTEAKLSKFAIDCIIDELRANPKCVDWTPNFDNTLMEPEFLPVKVPLLLINGTFGIALGKRTEIPSHNTNEVIDATIALIRDPNADVTLVPDHCMKCEIVMTDFSTISRTGYGYYKVRGIIDIEDYKGNKALVIKSTPNLLYLDDVSEKIDELIEKKKLVQVANCYDESSETDMRYVIVLRPGADPNYVRDVIYKETSLERTERINFEVLNGLEPIRMSYKSYLLSFIDHRKITKFRVYSNKLQAVQTRIHEKEIYIKVLESGEVDNIIAFIKKQKTVDDDYLINYLVKKLGITDLQAKFIINSDLRKLSIGYLNKYKEEIKGLTAERERYMSMVMDDHLIEAEIIAELEEIKAKYGKRRNCRIVKDRDRNEVPKGLMTVIVTEKNMIKKVPKGAPIGSFKGDTIKVIIEADNTDNLLIFDNLGKVYKLPISKIPFVETKSNGVDIRFLVKGLNADILSCIPERFTIVGSAKDNINRSYMVCLTRNGLIKKMDDSDFTNVPLSGIRYVKLDENDYVVSVRMADDSINFIAFSDRKAMLVPMDTVSNMKRNAKGNKTFKSDLADGLLEFYMNSCTYLLVITQNGRINKLPISGVPNLLIPRKAFSVIKLTKGDSIQNIIPVNENDTIEVTLMDSVMQLDVANYPVGSSISSGERAIPIRGNKILRTVKLLK